MNSKKVVLAWNSWLDIDAYACIIGLYEIMKLKWENVEAFIPEWKAVSITETLKNLPLNINLTQNIENSDLFLVDVSWKDFLEKVCGYNLENIKKIYDHHFESYDFWKNKLWENAKIEEIWACASIIVELAIEEWVFDKLSESAKLLLASAILSHTMDFKYEDIITNRDILAYENLKKDLPELDEEFIKKYFIEVSESAIKDLIETLKNDFKIVNLNWDNFSISQLEIWNQKDFIKSNKQLILDLINLNNSNHSFYLWISIEEWKTYFISNNLDTKELLNKVLWINFEDNIWIYEKIIIRKEVIKKILKLF